jgi:phosphatidylinositol alpha-1,6-mannosyltransferase
MENKPQTKRLLLVNSRLDSTGGIETYMKEVGRVYQEAGWSVTALNQRDTYNGEKGGLTWVGLMPASWLLYRICIRMRFLFLKRWLARNGQDYDLIICGHEQFASRVLPAAERFGLPFCVVLHGLEVWRPLPQSHIRALRKASALIHVSEFTRDEVIRRFQLEGANFVKITPCTEVVELDETMVTRSDSAEQLNILTVGRLAGAERDKGHRLAIQALGILKQRGERGVRYTIVGDGPDLPHLKQLSETQGVVDSVHFAGRVSDTEKLEAYQQTDVFVMVTPLQRLAGDCLSGEGFGIVYLEAAVWMKPVIGGDEGGSVDPVREGVNGYRCPQDAEALADILLFLLKNPEKRLELGANARRLVEAEFSFECIAQKWVSLGARLTSGQNQTADS